MTILRLIVEFFKTGLFAVGGGLATLPFLYEMGEKTGWFTAQDVLNLLAVSESTPGPIGINMSTYVGFITAGIPGAVIASLSLAAPCVIVILLVIRVLDKFKGSPLVESIFKALRPASIGMITAALIGVVRESLLHLENFAGLNTILSVFNWKGIALAVALWFIMKKWKTHPIAYIGIAAAAGIVFSFRGRPHEKTACPCAEPDAVRLRCTAHSRHNDPAGNHHPGDHCS
ncbi:MAG: chromate transporter [Oscillospiraceae bacterium]|nr:chromate transporter [Oscillospiraceae bacterium]